MRSLLLLFITVFTYNPAFAEGGLDSLLIELDKKVANNRIYCELKESRIDALKKARAIEPAPSAEREYSLNAQICGEYGNYVSDSAIVYMNRNLDIACALNDPIKVNATSIDLGMLFSNLGMYKEAMDALENIDRKYFDHRQLVDHYLAYINIYSGLVSYTQSHRDRVRYSRLTNTYSDSLIEVTSPSSEEYLRMKEMSLRENGYMEEALKINDRRMAGTAMGTPNYALIAFHRSLMYRSMGDVENEKKYLALSAISDVQSAIRDNASIPLLANMLMEEGDINRAYKYVEYSLDNITAYNTRIRSSEIINIQKIIDEAYHQKNEQQRKIMRLFLLLISVLSALLVVLLFWLYKQMRRRVTMNKRLEETNAELISLNEKLHNMNGELQKVNLEVIEANHLKEEYINFFLGECSKYVDKIDAFRKMTNKKLRDRQMEELYNLTKNNTLKEDELKELHSNFDTMFVHLFPDFIDKFNSLLLPGEQIVPKKGEILNAELRIYALIRLGIDDSCKIAGFLDYSVNTIYNYRTKVKNKARIAREDFEWTVKKIGSFKRE
jgi:tetratricopeptide (TPR) repeat protein